jgi:hypothetical protein
MFELVISTIFLWIWIWLWHMPAHQTVVVESDTVPAEQVIFLRGAAGLEAKDPLSLKLEASRHRDDHFLVDEIINSEERFPDTKQCGLIVLLIRRRRADLSLEQQSYFVSQTPATPQNNKS